MRRRSGWLVGADCRWWSTRRPTPRVLDRLRPERRHLSAPRPEEVGELRAALLRGWWCESHDRCPSCGSGDGRAPWGHAPDPHRPPRRPRRPTDRLGRDAARRPRRLRPPRDRDAALAVLRRAVELGVDHLDTSQYYGPDVVNALIREALHPYPDGLRLVTKVGARRDDGGRGSPRCDPRSSAPA